MSHEKKQEKRVISQWPSFKASLQKEERKKNKCTNEADGSAYEGVEVAACGVDVSLSPGTALPPGQTAEQDGLSNHDLLIQQHTCLMCLHAEILLFPS